MTKEPIQATEVGGVSGAKLKNFIERIKRVIEEREGLNADIREIFSEAKSFGFDVKIMRGILKIRKKDADARREEEELLDLYKSALGIE